MFTEMYGTHPLKVHLFNVGSNINGIYIAFYRPKTTSLKNYGFYYYFVVLETRVYYFGVKLFLSEVLEWK